MTRKARPLTTPLAAQLLDRLVEELTGALLPCFGAVANGPIDADTVRASNEAVLRARYEDAAFFYRADLAVAPAQLRQRLTGLTFADRLGPMHDRADLIAAVAAELTDLVELDDQQRRTLDRAQNLTKFELGSQLVTERTSLAGVMAGEYAAAGEPARRRPGPVRGRTAPPRR